MNLYEDHKTAWDALAKAGKPSLGEMAKHFKRATEMDAALDLNNAASHWAAGRNGATMSSERAAAAWLERNAKPAPTPIATSQGRVLMVVCNDATAERAMKMLGILGCEVVDV